jgi:hypothetical protein
VTQSCTRGWDDVMAKVIEFYVRDLFPKSEVAAPRPAWEGDRVSQGKSQP